MELSPTAALLLGLLLACWAFAAAAVIVTARRRVGQAHSARAAARRLARMIENAPVIPLIVRGDGALEGPARLAAWLGLETLPRFLSELRTENGGLEEEDLERLRHEVRRTLKTAAPFRLSVTPRGSQRSLALCGQFADRLVAPEGAALVWWFDFSESEEELARLRTESAGLRADLDGITGLIEAAPIPMWVRGPDLALRIVNSAYAAAVGADSPAEAVRGQIELLEAVEGRSPADIAGQARDSGESLERIVQGTIGGQRRKLRVRDLPVGAAGTAGFAGDIDEQERQGRALDAMGRAQRSLLERLPIGAAAFDLHGRLDFANAPFRQLFVLSQADEGAPGDFHRFLDEARQAGRLPESGDYLAWRRGLDEWFGGHLPVEQAWTLADGTHLRMVAQPMPDGGLIMLAEDRSEHFAHSARRDTLLRTRGAILDAIGEALAIFTPEGSVEAWNRQFAAMWGLGAHGSEPQPRGAEELLADMAQKLAPEDGNAAIDEAVRAATLERRAGAGCVRLADGRLLNFSAVPLPDGNGLLALSDVTGADAVAAAARERDAAIGAAQAARAEFLAEVGGRLRTGLLAIGGAAEALRDGAPGPLPPAAGEHIAAMIAGIEGLEARLESLLEEATGTPEVTPLVKAEIEVLPLVTALVREREAAVDARDLTLNLNGAKRTGSIPADEAQLRRALGSLLDDAIAGAPRGGRIDITLARVRAEVMIEISADRAGNGAPVWGDAAVPANTSPDGHRARLNRARRAIEAHGGRLSQRSGPRGTSILTITLA